MSTSVSHDERLRLSAVSVGQNYSLDFVVKGVPSTATKCNVLFSLGDDEKYSYELGVIGTSGTTWGATIPSQQFQATGTFYYSVTWGDDEDEYFFGSGILYVVDSPNSSGTIKLLTGLTATSGSFVLKVNDIEAKDGNVKITSDDIPYSLTDETVSDAIQDVADTVSSYADSNDAKVTALQEKVTAIEDQGVGVTSVNSIEPTNGNVNVDRLVGARDDGYSNILQVGINTDVSDGIILYVSDTSGTANTFVRIPTQEKSVDEIDDIYASKMLATVAQVQTRQEKLEQDQDDVYQITVGRATQANSISVAGVETASASLIKDGDDFTILELPSDDQDSYQYTFPHNSGGGIIPMTVCDVRPDDEGDITLTAWNIRYSQSITIHDKFDAIDDTTNSLSRKITDVTTSVADLKTSIAGLDTQVASNSELISSAMAKQTDTDAKVASITDSVSTCEEQLMDATSSITNLEVSINEATVEIGKTNENIVEIGERVKTIEDTIPASEESVSSLKEEVEALNSSIEGLDSIVSAHEGKITSLDSLTETMQDSIGTLDNKSTAQSEEIELIKEHISVIDTSIPSRVDVIEGKVEDIENTIEEDASRISDNANGITSVSNQIKSLQSSLSDVDSSITILEKAQATTQSVVDSMASDVKSNTSTISVLEGSVATNTSNITTLEQALTTNVSTLETYIEESIADVSEAISKNATEISALKTDMEDFEAGDTEAVKANTEAITEINETIKMLPSKFPSIISTLQGNNALVEYEIPTVYCPITGKWEPALIAYRSTANTESIDIIGQYEDDIIGSRWTVCSPNEDGSIPTGVSHGLGSGSKVCAIFHNCYNATESKTGYCMIPNIVAVFWKDPTTGEVDYEKGYITWCVCEIGTVNRVWYIEGTSFNVSPIKALYGGDYLSYISGGTPSVSATSTTCSTLYGLPNLRYISLTGYSTRYSSTGNDKIVPYAEMSSLSLGKYAFGRCENLSIAHLGNCEKIGDSSFSRCAGLSELVCDNVKEIDYGAFQYTQISEFNLPELETIEEGSFSYCSRVEHTIFAPKLKWDNSYKSSSTIGFFGGNLTKLTVGKDFVIPSTVDYTSMTIPNMFVNGTINEAFVFWVDATTRAKWLARSGTFPYTRLLALAYTQDLIDIEQEITDLADSYDMALAEEEAFDLSTNEGIVAALQALLPIFGGKYVGQ